MPRTSASLGLGLLLAATTALAACSPNSSSASTPGSAPVAVVASTDVWGSVVSAIGGSRVTVTSLISDPVADPRSYEADAQNQLAIGRAAIIVENGGGYDDFIDKLTSSAGSRAKVLDAVRISGYAAAGGGDLDAHVWYDFPTVKSVVLQIESALAAADPTDADTFAADANTFSARVTLLQQKEAAVKAKSVGVGVAITEPLPLYMLTAAGLVNKTPPAFSQAIEGHTDAPVAAVAQTLALFEGKKVKALVYDAQTTGAQTEQVLAAARANGIAVVPVTETLPAGQDYLGWMNANLDAIAAAMS